MTSKELTRRGFLKGAILSAIAGLLGIGVEVAEPEAAAVPGKLETRTLSDWLEALKRVGAPRVPIMPMPSERMQGLEVHRFQQCVDGGPGAVLVSEELVADAAFHVPPPYPVQWIVKDFELGSWTGNATAGVS